MHYRAFSPVIGTCLHLFPVIVSSFSGFAFSSKSGTCLTPPPPLCSHRRSGRGLSRRVRSPVTGPARLRQLQRLCVSVVTTPRSWTRLRKFSRGLLVAPFQAD